MNELIQCELCDIFVDFDEYLNHVRNCSENNSALTSSISSFLTYSISSYNSNDSIIEQDNEESDDETISYNIPIQIPIGIQIFNNNQYNMMVTDNNSMILEIDNEDYTCGGPINHILQNMDNFSGPTNRSSSRCFPLLLAFNRLHLRQRLHSRKRHPQPHHPIHPPHLRNLLPYLFFWNPLHLHQT